MFLKMLKQKFIYKFQASYFHKIGKEPLQYQTIGQLLGKAADRYGTALISKKQNKTLTFAQIREKADRLAIALQRLGFKKKDRIGIWMPNTSEWYISFAGCARSGMIAVGLNPSYTAPEIQYCINKVGIKAIICGDEFRNFSYYNRLSEICPQLQTVKLTSWTNTPVPSLRHIIVASNNIRKGAYNFEEILTWANSNDIENINNSQHLIKPEDPCNIQFTSGTTGKPKAAMLDHFNLLNNSYFVSKRFEISEKEPQTICLQVPFFHIFGLSDGLVLSLHHGTKLVLPTDGFNARKSLDAIQQEKCSIIYGTPTMYIDLIEEQKRKPQNIALDLALIGGASSPTHLLEEIKTVLNVNFVNVGYAITEGGGGVFQSTRWDSRLGTVGYLHDHLEAKIVDRNDHIVPWGTPGELCIRGYSTMMGYCEDLDQNKKADDGWIRTGDQFTLDQNGYGAILGRYKEIIIRGGENIIPNEIEDLIISHPDVVEVAVIGVPNERLGEEVCAVLRVKANANVTLKDVQEMCKGKLSHFKIPSRLVIVDEFPRTTSGKIQKALLQEMIKLGFGYQ